VMKIIQRGTFSMNETLLALELWSQNACPFRME
jgi:hypothetical protein